MATLQSHINSFDPSLDELPAWKRDLILRRRANAKIHGGKSNVIGGINAPYSPIANPQRQNSLRSLQGQPQLSVCSVQGAQDPLRTVCGHKENGDFNQSTLVSDVGREWCEKSEESLSEDRSSKLCDSDIRTRSSAPPTRKIPTSSTDMRGPSAMLHKGPTSLGGMVGLSPEGWSMNEEEEEFEYGPGIVSRLKNRYLSLALREAKGRGTTLRKYSSLEDLLDDGGRERRGRQTQKERPVPGGGGVGGAGAGGVRKESMKRARSMDSLAFRRSDSSDKVSKSLSSGALRHALGKEDIIIIETQRRPTENGSVVVKKEGTPQPKKTPLLEEEELPAPDTVKQVKQIFESSSNNSRASRGTAAKVASYKASQNSRGAPQSSPAQKPPLKAKPVQLQSKPTGPFSPPPESSKLSLKQVGKPLIRSSPKSNSARNETSPSLPSPSSPKILPTGNLTPITASVTAPYPTSSAKLPLQDDLPPQPRLHSPPTPLPPSPTLSHKPKEVITTPQPLKENQNETNENDRMVLQENKKNSEKSSNMVEPPPSGGQGGKTSGTEICDQKSPVETWAKEELRDKPKTGRLPSTTVDSSEQRIQSSSVMDVVRAAEAKSSSPLGLKASKGKDSGGRRTQQDNSSLVFNFSKRTDTPDYIENDGVDLSKRRFTYKDEPGYVIMPGYDGKTDSSTDGDDDMDAGGNDDDDHLQSSLPCNISFQGEGVIINGRSNLQRQPRTKKLEVSFDMPATSTYEYPSENSLTEEFDQSDSLSTSNSVNSSLTTNALSSTGGLASYTPSKLQLTDSFELGVSRSSAATSHPPTPPRRSPAAESEASLLLLQGHVRPADENETVTWSSESVPDLLF